MINLEITETAASDSSVVIENMLRLSRDGFTFSLDDYGTGYSNLMNMLSLPLSIIKVDKSIVWSYFDQSFTMSVAAGGENYATGNSSLEKDNNILEDLIPMFQARGLKVLCEGVETKEISGTINSSWLLRTFSSYEEKNYMDHSTRVDTDGGLIWTEGGGNGTFGIRPAMWVKKEAVTSFP